MLIFEYSKENDALRLWQVNSTKESDLFRFDRKELIVTSDCFDRENNVTKLSCLRAKMKPLFLTEDQWNLECWNTPTSTIKHLGL